MEVYIATDHAGFALKETLKPFIESLGHTVTDCGALSYEKDDDYPDFIKKAVVEVSKDPVNRRGVILGGSGQGEAIVANRYKSVRAAVFYGGDMEIVRLAREHNNANTLSIGARYIREEEAENAVRIFLSTSFNEEERHVRRIEKIDRNS